MKAFYPLYRTIGWPILSIAFTVLGPLVRKVNDGLVARRAVNGVRPWLAQRAHEGAVWIHCASGEFEYAKPVIQQLKRAAPHRAVLVTYFSTSFVTTIKSFPGVDVVCPLPWDTPHDLQEFLRYQKPSMLLIARTDVWPEMARQAKLFGIPSLLFSATLTSKSGRARGIGRWMSRATFSQLTSIFAVSKEDREEFSDLGLPDTDIKEAGDTRYDQVIERLAHPKPVRSELFRKSEDSRPVVICGSTWPEDETVLVAAARELKAELKFVFVPHEPSAEHLAQLEAELSKAGLSSIRYSKADNRRADVLLVDQVGLLAELYLQADFAFVGGSFKKNIHSVMEPLAAGCLTFVGPYYSNNREALEFRTIEVSPGVTAVHPVRSAEELSRSLKDAAKLTLPDLKSRIKKEVEARTGASQVVIDWITSRLPAE